MRQSKKTAAQGVGALNGGSNQKVGFRAQEHSVGRPALATFAILDAGTVVAIVASADAVRAFLMGGAHGG